MPRRDGTGPDGNGPRTGRGMGSCNSTKDAAVNGRGRAGLRKGCRRGCRWNNVDDVVSTEEQKDILMQQKTILENKLNLINDQLNNLQDEPVE